MRQLGPQGGGDCFHTHPVDGNTFGNPDCRTNGGLFASGRAHDARPIDLCLTSIVFADEAGYANMEVCGGIQRRVSRSVRGWCGRVGGLGGCMWGRLWWGRPDGAFRVGVGDGAITGGGSVVDVQADFDSTADGVGGDVAVQSAVSRAFC